MLSFVSRIYPQEMTAVYRFFDSAGCLLYVGVTNDIDARFRGHAKSKSWWSEVAHKDVIWFDSRLDALYEEAQAIRSERPVYNAKRGISPIGMMVIRRKSYLAGPLQGSWVQPKSGLAVSAFRINQVIDEIERSKSHAVVTHEGQVAGVAVPLQWFERACHVMGETVDYESMPGVHIEDLL